MRNKQALILLTELSTRVADLQAALTSVEHGMRAAGQEPENSLLDEENSANENNDDSHEQDVQDLEDALDLVDHVVGLLESMADAWPLPSEEAEQAQISSSGATYAAEDIPGSQQEPASQLSVNQQEPASQLSVNQQEYDEALAEGSVILGGQYRLIRLLHQRPRVNLYLAQRLILQDEPPLHTEKHQQLVAIRELVLAGLSASTQEAVKKAAFDEYLSPLLPGSLRVPGAGERARIANDRHYLVMQLSNDERDAMPLADLLLQQRQWPSWLNTKMALNWGAQLCRIVARLHRLGVVLGDLDPLTILVDGEGSATWPPTLLISWPPASHFWPDTGELGFSPRLYNAVFPLSMPSIENAFVAPETLQGEADERSDTYALGAILYLLLTRYAPVAASRQLSRPAGAQIPLADRPYANEHMTLIPPSILNPRIPPELEDILLRALELEPDKRFESAFGLVEALESVDLKQSAKRAAKGMRSPG